MSRVDQYQVHLVVAGRDCGLWITFGGGGVDSEETFTKDAFGLPREALGGAATITNWTVSRTFKKDRDPTLYQFLRSQCGRGRANGSVQLLDPDGFAVGKPEPYTGVLKSAGKEDVNIEGSDAMKINLEISADGPLSA